MTVRFVPATAQAPASPHPQQQLSAEAGLMAHGASSVWTASSGVVRTTRRVMIPSPRPQQLHRSPGRSPWLCPQAMASQEARGIHSPRIATSQARSPSPVLPPASLLRSTRTATGAPPPRTLAKGSVAAQEPYMMWNQAVRPTHDLDRSMPSLPRAGENKENVAPPSSNLMQTMPVLKLPTVSRPPPQTGISVRTRKPRASLPAHLDAGFVPFDDQAARDARPQAAVAVQRPPQVVSVLRDLSATVGRQAPQHTAPVVRARRATLPTPMASPEVPTPRDLRSPAAALVQPSPAPELSGDAGGAPAQSILPQAWTEFLEAVQDGLLGGGAFAEVFRVRHRLTGRCFAVKVMHRPNFAMRGIEQQIDLEVGAMLAAAAREDRRCDNEGHHVLRLYNVTEENDYVYLLMDLCEEGDLLRKLTCESRQRFDEDCVATWARQLFLGLRLVHSLGFLHRDIKPDNLLCADGGRLKIADFGWCCMSRDAPASLAGTFQYMAPEVLLNQPQTEQVDVWSAGVTLYQMLLGRPLLNTYLGPGATQVSDCDPHRSTAIKQRWLVEEICATCPPPLESRPDGVTPLCWDFMRCLLTPEPAQRISVDAALEHPWLATGPIAH